MPNTEPTRPTAIITTTISTTSDFFNCIPPLALLYMINYEEYNWSKKIPAVIGKKAVKPAGIS
jgi:hypothetical protein